MELFLLPLMLISLINDFIFISTSDKELNTFYFGWELVT